MQRVVSMVKGPVDKTTCSYCGDETVMVISDIVHLCNGCSEQFLLDMETHLSSLLFDDDKHRA